MKLIKRQKYINKLMNVKGTPDIKVITGIRRSGKSKLLESFIQEIENKETNFNIIHIDFNKDDFESLTDYHALLQYVKYKYKANADNYLFIDEVQMCNGFERAINSLHASSNYDVYITGSSAFLLSIDLATLFTGRTFEVDVYPFSYKEFIEYYELPASLENYNSYLLEGGMSGSYLYKDIKDKRKYLKSIFDTLVLRDIKQKYKIRNELILSKVTDYLIDNIANLTSVRNISDDLNKNGYKIDHKTVSRYIGYLCNAFAFYKVKRYDIQGKKYLSSTEKYYLADHSFKYAYLGTKNQDFGKLLENIVAIELLRNGYEIYVGILYQKEIDFVAIKDDEKIYIQVANSLEDEKTKERELDPLRKIKDAYPKMIISRTGYPEYNIDGIKIIDISDWLNSKN